MNQRIKTRSVFRRFSSAAVLACATAVSVSAWCLEPYPRVCTEFYDSDAVFTGTVVGVRAVKSGGRFIEGWYYRMKVSESFRGPSGPFVEVYTENASARYPLEKGRKYLLFAGDYTGVLRISCCGNSGYIEDSAEAIRQIEEIKKTKSGGEIAGEIRGLDGEFEGARIIAVGDKQTYETKVDSQNWFHMKVPDGTYRLHAEAPGRSFVPFDLTYDNPDHIVVQPGGCPQMEFMLEERANYPRRPAR